MGRNKLDQTNCCVFGCSSVKYKEKFLSFHHFPTAGKEKVKVMNFFGEFQWVDRRQAWVNALRMGKSSTRHVRVCSKHFTAEDFFDHRNVRMKAALKKTAVPSRNLPNEKEATINEIKRRERYKRRGSNKVFVDTTHNGINGEGFTQPIQEDEQVIEKMEEHAEEYTKTKEEIIVKAKSQIKINEEDIDPLILSENVKVEEDYSIFGQYVASQLQLFPLEEAIILQAKIDEIITEARHRSIKETSTILGSSTIKTENF